MAEQVLVFISHTSAMREYPRAGRSFVAAAEQAVNEIPVAKAVHMAHFTAADRTPADYSLDELRRAALFVAVIGFDRGSTVRGDSRTYTELEFDEATRLRKPRLVFLLERDAIGEQRLTPNVVHRDQWDFRTRLEESGATVAYFSSVEGLQLQVHRAVNKWVADRAAAPRPPRPSPPGPGRPVVAPLTPRATRAGNAAAGGCLLSVVAALAVAALVAWTAISGRFPPWSEAAACEGVSMTIEGTSAPAPGFSGVVLDVSVTNSTDGVLQLPAARDVLASGRSGRQYATESAPGDRSWFFDVTVQPGATARLKVALDEPDVSDDITLAVPKVGGLGLPLTTCELRSAPAPVGRG